MKLYIPEIGTEIELTKGWTFPLHFERRNESLGKHFGIKAPDYTNCNGYVHKDHWFAADQSVPVTLPKGTILKVDRIYIRKTSWGGDAKKFSSVSFFATLPDAPKKGRKPRFWAKLRDVNNIEGTVISDPLEQVTP